MTNINTSNYHHIDNGGVSIKIETQGENNNTSSITFDTTYYGYPSIASTIYLSSDSLEILEMYRNTITQHIAKMKIKQ